MTALTEQEQRLSELLAKAHAAYLRLTVKQDKYVISELDRTRLQIIELITEYAKNDTIAKGRLNPLLRDIEQVERAIRDIGLSSLIDVQAESIGVAFDNTSTALQSTLALSSEFVLLGRIAESTVLSGFDRKPTAKNIATYLAERTGPDGLKLSDRVWTVAGDQRDAINRVLRNGIIRGDTTSRMIRDVKAAYDNETWKVRRLVLTESNNAYRTALGYVAERNKFVKAIRIHRGLADRPEHRCSALENADKHGLGAGVYLPSDTEIYGPHPNCTSYLSYVLIDEGAR